MYLLYHFPQSQHARRVVSLLEEAGLEYELRHVAMDKGEHRSAAYLAINPNHQVPTLVDGDVTIHESNAILRYLCAKHRLNAWYPEDLPARAKVEQWLDWNQCRLSPAVVDIVLNSVFLGAAGDRAFTRPVSGTATVPVVSRPSGCRRCRPSPKSPDARRARPSELLRWAAPAVRCSPPGR